MAQQELDRFFNQFKLKEYKKKETVLNAGQNPSGVFYIKRGYIRVYRLSEEGEELSLIILKPGDLFPVVWGESNFLENCYFEALTTTAVYMAPRELFMHFAQSNPEIYQELTLLALGRLDGFLARIEYMVFGNAYTKVASTLLVCANRFGDKNGSDVVLQVPLTHKDIATLVGITRETTCLEMKKLEKKGLISHRGRLLVVKDIAKLSEESLLDSGSQWRLGNSL